MEKRNLIVGTITNYKFHVVEPFFSTLRSIGYSGDVVLFHRNIAMRTLSRLQQMGVVLVPFGNSFPYLQANLAKHLNRWVGEKRINNLSLLCVRFLLAYCYLKEFTENYQHVMLSDIRDVIFQKDPFDFAMADKLCCFLEREGVSIGHEAENAGWIESAFDRNTIELLYDKPIVCAGVTIGPINLVLEYLEEMIDLFMRAPGKAWEVATPSPGQDQAVHNYLVFSGLLPEVAIYPNDGGPVLTLGLEEDVSVNDSGLIINKRGDVPNVVHQYDRHWRVAKRYYGYRSILEERLRALEERLRAAASKALSERMPRFHRFLVKARDSLGRFR